MHALIGKGRTLQPELKQVTVLMKKIIVLSAFVLMVVLHSACSEEGNKSGQKEQPKVSSVDSIATVNRAKRAQDIVNQAAQLAGVYCKCTERAAETSRKECKEQVLGAVNQITAVLKGAEKDAFEATYNEGTKSCK